MRWGLAFGAICVTATLIVCGRSRAQEIEDIDFNVLSSPGETSFWSSLFDPKIARRKPFDYLSGGMPDRVMLYAGLDASHWSGGAYAGMQWAPAGLNKDGFVLRFYLAESLERFVTLRNEYDTAISRAAILPGYQWTGRNLEVQLLAGPDLEADFFFVDRNAQKWRSRIGLRGVVDVWWEPTQLTMLQYSLSGTTIDSGYSTRIAAGFRVFDLFWIGPEAALSTDYFGQQTRLGGHLTGLRTGAYEWSFAAGYVEDNFQRHGAYGRLAVMLRPPRPPFFEN